MEAFVDPSALAGLTTLIFLEIVLGIDNLIFIAILSDKLPLEQRRRARVIGLTMALGMRLILLSCISWMIALDHTLFTFLAHDISGRDLIMLFGGVFLLFKATMELHEKLEGGRGDTNDGPRHAKFWHVIVQIVVLDAVFSLDAVITAIGMVDHLSVMITSVCIAMVLMIIASNPLMNFVSSRPTVVILCLGFLLLIGFSLIIEGLGYHIPKGYLYAAIGFSILIEAFNQTAQWNRQKTYKKLDPRTRVSQAVLSILGARQSDNPLQKNLPLLALHTEDLKVFKPLERMMISRVLHLAQQSTQSIMTPRYELYWIDLKDPPDVILRDIRECPYSCLIVVEDGKIEVPLGIIHKKEIADFLIQGHDITQLRQIVRQPLILSDSTTALKAMETFRKNRMHYAFVIDEYGTLEGFITMTDVAEAIAGDMPESHESDAFMSKKIDDGKFLVNGSVTIQELSEIIGSFEKPEGDYNTAAGIALSIMKKLPKKGDIFFLHNWKVSIEEMSRRRITRMKFEKIK